MLKKFLTSSNLIFFSFFTILLKNLIVTPQLPDALVFFAASGLIGYHIMMITKRESDSALKLREEITKLDQKMQQSHATLLIEVQTILEKESNKIRDHVQALKIKEGIKNAAGPTQRYF